MPYSHFHDWSFHTHHRRPKGGNHYRSVRRRQRPWRIGALMVLVLTVVAGAIWLGAWLNTQGLISGEWTDVEIPPPLLTLEATATQLPEVESPRTTPTVLPPSTATVVSFTLIQQVQQSTESIREEVSSRRSARQTAVATTNEMRQDQHERAIVSHINRERAERGIGILSWDDRLRDIARAHSQDMADKDYFEHTNKAGLNYRQRAVVAGYRCANRKWGGVAENLYFGPRGHKESSDAVKSWLGSPLHKRAMLDASFRKAAVGIHEGHLSGLGSGYFTTLLLC